MEKEATKVYRNLITYVVIADPLPKGVHMKPIVSIGMCLLDNEKTLRGTLDSVIKQDFPYELMEIIVVDGCSRDQTLSIIRDSLLKSGINVRIFSENKGLGFARQIVVDNSLGKYILWVDGDIILSKDYLRKQVKFMDNNPRVGITAGITGILSDRRILTLELIPAVIEHMRSQQPRSFVWKTDRFPGTAGATFRVKALRQVNGFDDRLTGASEDMDVARRIKDAGWLIRLNNAVYYERHGDMRTLRDLCKKYAWYGYGHHSLYRKNRDIFSLPRMCPPAGFITGFLYSLIAYKLLHRKIVFLLPFHFALKMTAWCLGFIKSQIMQRALGKSERAPSSRP